MLKNSHTYLLCDHSWNHWFNSDNNGPYNRRNTHIKRKEYATAAWDPYTSCNIKDIEMVQRRAARYVKRDYQRTTSVTSLLDSLHWQSLQDRRRNAHLLHFFKALHGYQGLSQIVNDLPRPTRLTRSSCVDVVAFSQLPCRTDVFKFSFLPPTDIDWNFLDTEVWPVSSGVFSSSFCWWPLCGNQLLIF